jgi:hypothetical protein
MILLASGVEKTKDTKHCHYLVSFAVADRGDNYPVVQEADDDDNDDAGRYMNCSNYWSVSTPIIPDLMAKKR